MEYNFVIDFHSFSFKEDVPFFLTILKNYEWNRFEDFVNVCYLFGYAVLANDVQTLTCTC